jgi:hypothetical protein
VPARKALRARPRQLSLEQLESREAPAVSVFIQGGVLIAQADSGFDDVRVFHSGSFAFINGQAFSDASYNSIRVNGGAGGTHTTIFSNVKPVTVNGAAANDVVDVGNSGSLAGIMAPLTLNNGPSFSHVNINDAADGSNHTTVLTSFSLTGLAPAAINFQANSLDGLTIAGGNGNNVYTVVNTQFSSLGNPTTLNTGNGNDTVNVQGTQFNGPLTVNTGSGNDLVTVGGAGTLTGINAALTINSIFSASEVDIFDGADNTNHANVQLTGNSLTGLAPAPINFGSGFQAALRILVGNGNDNFLINGTPGLNANLLTGTATNAVTFAAGGPLTLIGSAAGTNTLTGPSFFNVHWVINGANSGFLDGLAFASFMNYQNLIGGSSSNTFVFNDGATLSGTLNGGSGGTNTLDSSAYSTSEVFAITGANAGSGTPVGAFRNIQNLIGGAGGTNDFAFSDGGSLSGTLNGGTGAGNTLDYSNGFSGNVVVDLATGAASGVAGLGAGAVTNIEKVLGASGGGSSFFDLLIGNGGNVLQGGTGRRNILVAGGSPSTLVGGDGEDLLIAGSTAYDTDPALANWQAIVALWTDGDPFATRVSNLLSGSGAPILDPTAGTGTVFGNGGGNTLTGNGALALLVTDGLDTISGFDANSQQVTIGP